MGIKVLMVDDSAILRKKLKEMIYEIDGIDSIGEAKNLSQASNSLKRLNPDVVILDIRLNGESGIDILKEIKKSRPETKVIMFTNYPYPQYEKKCKALGADYFLDKSTEFDKVTEILNALIQSTPVFSKRTERHRGG